MATTRYNMSSPLHGGGAVWQIDSPGGAVLQRAPASGAVVGDEATEELQQGVLGYVVPLAEADGARRLVLVPGRDQAVGVGDDPAVVHEHVHVVLGRQEGRDVAVADEVGLDAALDRLGHLRVGSVQDLADPLEGLALPARERGEVVVDAGVAGGHRCSASTARRTTSGSGAAGRSGRVLST